MTSALPRPLAMPIAGRRSTYVCVLPGASEYVSDGSDAVPETPWVWKTIFREPVTSFGLYRRTGVLNFEPKPPCTEPTTARMRLSGTGVGLISTEIAVE